ncbi:MULTISPECIES: MFS transporter [unclassified Gilliamella]|uniref:MFS transporter n=1 Tax=unclassified Gilliamella TaxID=2685620 RepID=UPI002269B02B|nr:MULTISPECIES: MFS transporter [unclassified Gilliamella]MCX8573675.1 MFS transporter [Gilliamella sp. B3831]MCX8575697.1 MFS transporter [Gilliamella sp. B3815]MCX8578169.1 MFS transporter [Gilliamella sp. B2717]MCX8589898.1 MFS transporter [Gilliamella sp. B3812]MCX8602799.1 MFS transporter [Gilliamella sp. B3823]
MNKKDNYRWFVLGVGVLAQATFAMGFAGIPITGILMRDAYNFSLYELGFVLGAMGLGVAASEIIWGILTDKLGDKTVLTLGLWSSAGVFVVIAVSLTPEASYDGVKYLHLAGTLAIAGIFGGSINSSSGRTIMSWFDDSERGFAMSIRQTAIPVGGAIGTGLFPWLAYTYGFEVTFIVLATIGFIVGLVVVFFINSKHTELKYTDKSTLSVSSPLKSFEVWKIVMSAGFLTVPQMAVLTFGGVYMRDVLNIDLASISIILIGVQIGGGILRIWSGYYTDRKKNRIPLLKYFAILGGITSLVLCLMVSNTYMGVVFLVLTGLFGHAWHGIAYTEAAVRAGVNRAGTALGMVGTTVFISSFLTPILVSRVAYVYGWRAVWATVAILTFSALLCFILFPRNKEPLASIGEVDES